MIDSNNLLQTLDDEAISSLQITTSAANSTPVTLQVPMSEQLRWSYLLILPFFTLVAVVTNGLLMLMFSSESMQRFRVCVFLRYLAFSDILCGLTTLGLQYVSMANPSIIIDSMLRTRSCRVYTWMRYTVQDMCGWGLVALLNERLISLLIRDYTSMSAVVFVTSHRFRIQHLLSKCLLINMTGALAMLNAYLIFCKGNNDLNVADFRDCFNSWKNPSDFSMWSLPLFHIMISSVSPSIVCLIGWITLRFASPYDSNNPGQYPRRTPHNTLRSFLESTLRTSSLHTHRPISPPPAYNDPISTTVGEPALMSDQLPPACEAIAVDCQNPQSQPLYCSSLLTRGPPPYSSQTALCDCPPALNDQCPPGRLEPPAYDEHFAENDPRSLSPGGRRGAICDVFNSESRIGRWLSRMQLCNIRHCMLSIMFTRADSDEWNMRPVPSLDKDFDAMTRAYALFYMFTQVPQLLLLIFGFEMNTKGGWSLLKNFGLAADLITDNRVNFIMFIYLLVGSKLIVLELIEALNKINPFNYCNSCTFNSSSVRGFQRCFTRCNQRQTQNNHFQINVEPVQGEDNPTKMPTA